MFEVRLGELAEQRSWSDALVEEILANAEALMESPGEIARAIAERNGLGAEDEACIAGLPATSDEFDFDEEFGGLDPQDIDPGQGRMGKPGISLVRIVDDMSDVFADAIPPADSEPDDDAELIAADAEDGELLIAGEMEDTLEAALEHLDTVDIAPKMVALCATVGAAHHTRHAFGNLSPSNIRVGDLGEVSLIDPRAPGDPAYLPGPITTPRPTDDVFSLGRILLEAYGGELEGIPTGVRQVIERATHPKARNRFKDALELLRALQAALMPVEGDNTALMLSDAARQARDEAQVLREQAQEALAQLPHNADEESRRTSWRELVAAEARESDAAAFEQAALFELLAAAAARPDDPAVNDALADHLQRTHRRLEQRVPAAAPGEVRAMADLIRRYDRSARHHGYLEGKGRLTLHTGRPATVDLYRYEARDRRLWPTPVGSLGSTPIEGLKLPMGSYVAILHAEGGPDLRYPIALGRQEHWNGALDPDGAPHVVPLPRAKDLREDEIYVPGGPFTCGGGDQGDTLPLARVWEDGFIVQKHPVTMDAYLQFLAGIRIRSGAEISERCLPQTPERSSGFWPRLLWSQNRYHLISDDQNRRWDPAWPAVCIPYHGALAFAEWQAERDGMAWSLPTERQWEKAARGVDARTLPWGSKHAEVLYARFGAAHPVFPDAFPADSSPYGVRGTAGNVAEWVISQDRQPGEGYQIARGGHFASGPGGLNLTHRSVCADGGAPVVGFRLARPYPADR